MTGQEMARFQPSLAPSGFVRAAPFDERKFLFPDDFRERLEIDARRHARYLGGFGVVRFGIGDQGRGALVEALATETRETDVVAEMSDRTFALLVVEGDADACERIVRRLESVVRELSPKGMSERLRVGIGATRGRRMTADEVWSESARDFMEDAGRFSEQ